MLKEFDEYGIIPDPRHLVGLFSTINLEDKERIIGIKKKSIFNDINQKNVVDSLQDQCNQLAIQFNLHPDIVFMLLESHKWNISTFETLCLSDRQSLLASIGINNENGSNDPNLNHPNHPGECAVCCVEYLPEELLQLPCGHYFCIECWRLEVETKVSQGMIRIPCQQGEGCLCCLPPTSVRKLCSEQIYNNLINFIKDKQISLSDILTNCPNPPCSKPLSVLDIGPCDVMKCNHCNHEFCQICNENSHAPCSCSERDRWNLITDEDLMQNRLLGDLMKRCPGCNAIIEKNEGCMHMTCRNCRHEFCWLCLKEWETHPRTYYECRDYNPDTDPYKRKPDNINPQFLGLYHDSFTELKAKNIKYFDIKFKLSKLLSKKIPDTTYIRRNQIEEVITQFLDILFWSRNVLMWSKVKLFSIRYEQIKSNNIPYENQEKCDLPYSKEFKLLEDLIKQFEKIVQDSNSICDIILSSGTYNSNRLYDNLKQSIKLLKLFKIQILKMCDPRYN